MHVVGVNDEQIEVLVTGGVLDDRGYTQGILDRLDRSGNLDRHHFSYDWSGSGSRRRCRSRHFFSYGYRGGSRCRFRCWSRCFFSYGYRFRYSLRNHRFNHLLHGLRHRSGNRSRSRFFFGCDHRFIDRYRCRGRCTRRQSEEQ
jgi:hypothetical protein